MSDSGIVAAPETTSVLAPPPQRTRWKTWLLRLTIVLAVIYLTWVLIFLAGQEFLIFYGANRWSPAPSGPSDPAIERWWHEFAPEQRVEAWFQLGVGRTPDSPGPAVVFFHGNRDGVDTRWYVAKPWVQDGVSILAVEYRGYVRSAGLPSEPALIDDSIAFIDRLLKRPEIDTSRIIYQANSLGGGVALGVAQTRPPRALILESTFTNIPDVVDRSGIPPFLCRHTFRNDQRIAKVTCPILISHGKNDWLIPFKHAQRLQRAAPHAELVSFNGGHVDYQPNWPAIRTFLQKHGLRETPQ